MPAERDPALKHPAPASVPSAEAPRIGAGLPAPSVGLMFMALAPFAFGYLFSYLYRGANAVVAGDLVAELGLSPAELGLLTAAYLGAFAAFQLPLGVLLDRYGPRRVQAALVALGACGALLFAFGRDTLTLTIARGIIGIAFSGGLMSCFKAVVIWVSEPRRALANACLMSMGGVGLLISTTPLELAARSYGWRWTFMALAAVTLVAAAFIFFVVPERQGVSAGTEPLSRQIRQIGRIYRDRVFLALAPFVALTSGTHIALQTLWAGPWLRDVVGLDRLGVANSLFIMATGFVASILLAGVITDALVRRGYSLLTAMLLFQVTFMATQVGLLCNPTDPWIAIALWSLFCMTGHASVVSFPWLSRYFGAGLSGRSNSAANLLMFLWAFLVQYGAGAIIGWFPVPEPGRYAPVAYQVAIGTFLSCQVLALLWFFANRRRLAAAETQTI
jgi:predicted MFS family arabinose efflux permease